MITFAVGPEVVGGCVGVTAGAMVTEGVACQKLNIEI